jgi:hypothetical protein
VFLLKRRTCVLQRDHTSITAPHHVLTRPYIWHIPFRPASSRGSSLISENKDIYPFKVIYPSSRFFLFQGGMREYAHMKIIRGYKTELDVNNKQRIACLQHVGAERFAYNWALNWKREAYKKDEKAPTTIDLHRDLNTLKKTELSWMYGVSKCAPQEALRNVNWAYDHFFRKVKLKKQGRFKGNVGFPQFKKEREWLIPLNRRNQGIS